MAIGGQASAATIDYEVDSVSAKPSDRVVYTADPQEANQVTVNCCIGLFQTPEVVVLTDPGALIEVGPSPDSQQRCLAVALLAECSTSGRGPQASIGYLDAFLGPNNDRLRVQETPGIGTNLFGEGGGDALFGGDGGDHLDGGPGPDGLHGAGSVDTIEARDGTPDVITCGAGTDTVFADAVDSVAAGCENVQIG
ncbi:MAG: hypothetical protein ACRDKX_07315 [Solirubrobacterales bacterium]